MKMKHRLMLAKFTAFLVSTLLISADVATASPKLPSLAQLTPTLMPSQEQQELEKLRVEQEIRDRVQSEVDRAFVHTTTIVNILLFVMTLVPFFIGFLLWLLYGSVKTQIVLETKKQVREEVEKALEQEIMAELQIQTEAFKQQIEILRSEFLAQLSELQNLLVDTQSQKEQIFQELYQVTPSSIQETVSPEIHQKIHDLTVQLEALEYANPKLVLNTKDYAKQGDAFYFEGRYDDAVTFYDKALEIKPDYYEVLLNRGTALDKLRRYSEAIASYDQAIQIKPDKHEPWNNRGVALQGWKRYSEAIASYDEAIRLKPDAPNAWYNRSCCYALQGKVALAVKSLRKAIQLAPNNKEYAKTEPNFEVIWEDEQFKQLISE